MFETIYKIFEYLTDISYNVWFWLLIVTAPLCVFSVKPKNNVWIRIGRLVIAIGLTYVFINLSLHTSRAIEWKSYELCQSQFLDGAINHHSECPEINIADGASNIFYLILGWVPAAAYVAFWEWLWLQRYRIIIKEMEDGFCAKWFSILLIIPSIPIWFCCLMLLGSFIYLRIDCPKEIIVNGSCWIPH